MVMVKKRGNFSTPRENDDVKGRSAIRKSNISMQGEASRHKKPVVLTKLKFLEKAKNEKPSRA